MLNTETDNNGIYQMLDTVELRPGMYVGALNFTYLSIFLYGYQFCNRQHNYRYKMLYPLPFELFTSYCSIKFHQGGSVGFEGIILQKCNQDQKIALQYFFRKLKEFRKKARVSYCRLCDLNEENIKYHTTKGVVKRELITNGIEKRMPAYQNVKRFYHISFSYGADLLIPVSNCEYVSGQLFYSPCGKHCIEVFENLEIHMEACFGSVEWRRIEIGEDDILLLLNDFYFNNGRTNGFVQCNLASEAKRNRKG